MSKSRLFRVSPNREDRGVAEIVGAILLFAVVITLFTSFMVWYIPAQTTSNEVHYEQQTKSTLGSLISDIHDGTPGTGSTISQSISLGISGVSIFSSPQDTEFSILPQSASFNATLAFSVSLNVTNSTGTHSVSFFNESYSVSGTMASNGNTEYVTPINYVVEDGSLFQNYGNGQPSNTLGPMPMGIVNSSGQYGLSLSIFGITGQSETFSSTQSQVVNLGVNSSQSYAYRSGSFASIGGSQYTVNNLTLDNLSYSINSSLVNAWNYGLFGQFNTSQAGYQNVIGMKSWNFTALPFSATVSGNRITMTNSNAVPLNSISTEYLLLYGL